MAIFQSILTLSAQHSFKKREGKVFQFWKMKQLADDEKGHPCPSNVSSPSRERCRQRASCFCTFLFPSSCALRYHTPSLPFNTLASWFFHSLVFSKLFGVPVELSSRNIPDSSHHVSSECIVYVHSHNTNPSLCEPRAELPRCRHLATQRRFLGLGSGLSTVYKMVKKN